MFWTFRLSRYTLHLSVFISVFIFCCLQQRTFLFPLQRGLRSMTQSNQGVCCAVWGTSVLIPNSVETPASKTGECSRGANIGLACASSGSEPRCRWDEANGRDRKPPRCTAAHVPRCRVGLWGSKSLCFPPPRLSVQDALMCSAQNTEKHLVAVCRPFTTVLCHWHVDRRSRMLIWKTCQNQCLRRLGSVAAQTRWKFGPCDSVLPSYRLHTLSCISRRKSNCDAFFFFFFLFLFALQLPQRVPLARIGLCVPLCLPAPSYPSRSNFPARMPLLEKHLQSKKCSACLFLGLKITPDGSHADLAAGHVTPAPHSAVTHISLQGTFKIKLEPLFHRLLRGIGLDIEVKVTFRRFHSAVLHLNWIKCALKNRHFVLSIDLEGFQTRLFKCCILVWFFFFSCSI